MSIITVRKDIQPTQVVNSSYEAHYTNGSIQYDQYDWTNHKLSGHSTTRTYTPYPAYAWVGYLRGETNWNHIYKISNGHAYHVEGTGSAQFYVLYDLETALNELRAAYPPDTYRIVGVSYAAGIDLNAFNISRVPPMQNVANPTPGTNPYPNINEISIQGDVIKETTTKGTSYQFLSRVLQEKFQSGEGLSNPIYVYKCSLPSQDILTIHPDGAFSFPDFIMTHSYGKLNQAAPLVIDIYLSTELEDFCGNLVEVSATPTPPAFATPPAMTSLTESAEQELNAVSSGANQVRQSFASGGGSSSGPDIISPEEFDYIYIPSSVPITELKGVVVGGGIIGGSVEGVGLTNTGIFIESIKQSLTDADYMTFIEVVKYDSNGSFQEGNKVFGLVYGQTKFAGYIKSKRRVINDREQYIRYEAAGVREWLYKLPFASVYKNTDKSLKDLFDVVASQIPNALVTSMDTTKMPTDVKIPEFIVEAATIGYSFDQILDYAGRIAYYIDHTKKLTVYDLENLTEVNFTIPSEGTTLSSTHKVLSKDLAVDVGNCYTRCILEGDYPYIEEVKQLPVEWTVQELGANTKLMSGKIKIGRAILPTLLSNENSPLQIYYIDGSGRKLYFAPGTINCNTGEIGLAPYLSFMPPQLYVQYAYRDYYPLKYDTGWMGTAYTAFNVQNVMMRKDTRFKKIVGAGDASRDDTETMRKYAEELIAPYKDWRLGGTVTLDGLNLDVAMGKCVNFLNTSQSSWTSIKLAIFSITWNFADGTTQLELSNNYIVNTSIPDPDTADKKIERARLAKVHQLSNIEQNNPYKKYP